MSFMYTGVSGLNFPLMSLIHHRGFCIIASSLVPITSASLQYGSADAGNTSYASNKELNKKMKKAGKVLNLMEHMVNNVKLTGPGDIGI